MSGPAGSGAGHLVQKGAGFAGVVGSLARKKRQSGSGSSAASTAFSNGIDGVGPSKGLPSTGLKRNTQEWKDEHGDSGGKGRRRRKRRGSQSSSSSILSEATGTGSEDDGERDRGQEGAEGRGPGKHERNIMNGYGHGQGEITESPTEEKDLKGGMEKSRPPKDGDDQIRGERRLDTYKVGRASQRDKDGHSKENGYGLENGHAEEDGIDSEEKMLGRHEGRNKGLTDEKGRMPDDMPGVKEEQSPGPRNEIVLDPRISHMSYHQKREFTGKRIEKGPILTLTADGEDEVPAGQTTGPSRASSFHQANGDKAQREGSGGSWTTAMNGQPRPVPPKRLTARFSYFRHSHASSDRDRGDHEESDSDHRAEPSSADREAAHRRWSSLRARVLPSRNQSSGGPSPSASKVTALSATVIASVPITTELLAGQLPVMILKTWLDRDENGNRAVPVLLGNLRFRVGDSVGLRIGKETGKEMFKVECEYGDGVVKWVIYRQLRDFLSLHAHYKAGNIGSSVAGLRTSRRVEIPEFPKMSIPYLKKLTGRDGSKEKPVGKQEYAQASRTALQNYLVALIRAVVFRPESNRLCQFFELSSLTLSLAPRGGFQGKAGYLKIPGGNASRRANQPGLTPTSWAASRSPKWFIVRDSYFVAASGPEATEYYDVFMIDADFAIERPKRVYRTSLHLFHKTTHSKIDDHKADGEDGHDDNEDYADNPMAADLMVTGGEGEGDRAEVLQDDGEKKASQHTFFIVNSQRRLKLVARNARQMHQFIVSMERIAAQCIWTGRNRFDSFAPLRVNVAAQWLVDGRDYFWNLSRAINMAKSCVYIHDWWISPELYLRRPNDERYRLDNLLKRKAEDGVKIFIIVYNEVSDKTTPVDSPYTKRTLTGLHPNIMLQRSPSHFQTGTFYWSHHEKLCVIDETIAFIGGLDLCYGRWDTSQHILTDEDFTEPDGPNGPVWRGKDYSNERVAEYKSLDKPFEDTFDRSKVPRMPWHDVGIQIVGQPARDLCRHFVQRWNLLIRTKNHKRYMPFLLPAADFTDRELRDLKLEGTCEVQICRSVGPWSMGTPTKIEHSIQNAYCKSIEMSDHFIYIENQFFITSTVVDGVPIENGIGDALVNRIIRAFKEHTPWRACIVIPLLPGYTYPIDSNEASSVRLILECQNRTICRGTNSIFSRLRKEGIDPDDYITFFSLRGWAKFKSGVLTTEQVYIHGKTMIVDDRLVLCGSANINERSQQGDRDSELIAVVRDTDMIDGTMAGKPFKVGRFAHTLRMRLMREHVGVDVDSIDEDQLMFREPVAESDEIETWDPDHEQEDGDIMRGITTVKRRTARDLLMRTVENSFSSVTKGMSENAISHVRKAADTVIHPISVIAKGQTLALGGADGDEEREDFDQEGQQASGFASSMVPTLEEKTMIERRPSHSHQNGNPLADVAEEAEQNEGPAEAQVPGSTKEDGAIAEGSKEAETRGVPRVQGEPGDKELFGAPADAHQDDDRPPTRDTKRSEGSEHENAAISARKVLRKQLNAKVGTNQWALPTPTPKINPNRFHDPLDERFWKDMWVATAVHNTEIFRKVFRCVPDDLVTSWTQYKAFANHAEKFNKRPEDVAQHGGTEPVKVVHDGPGTHGAGGGGSGGGAVGQGGDKGRSEIRGTDVQNGRPNGVGAGVGMGGSPKSAMDKAGKSPGSASVKTFGSDKEKDKEKERKPSGPEDAWHEWERQEMEDLLEEVRGHLVIYSTRFLEAEDKANNFLFNSDRILPLPIYD